MIISASYKTDIPAFYGQWFRNRLHAGFCRMVNPYNRNQHQLISLRTDDVDGFVFWTKNLNPFLDTLSEVDNRGFPFVVQYTINGYPRALESCVVDTERSLDNFCAGSDKYGPRSFVWRYDPIVFSTITDVEFHLRNFAYLAKRLSGYTNEVVVSFMQLYKKTLSNMESAALEHDFDWFDPPSEDKRKLLNNFMDIAMEHQISLAICTQPDLMVRGVKEARCIDGERLAAVAGREFRSRIKGMRTGCGCYESKDIGDYDTCPHGCIYCYAVQRRPLALQRFQAHDSSGEYLITQGSARSQEDTTSDRPDREQLPLFPHGGT